MKRSASEISSPTIAASPSKRQARTTEVAIPVEHSTDWPAPVAQIEAARDIIRSCAKANAPTLLLPDKDADGLSAACILRRTLVLLGLDASKIDVHFISKGSNLSDSTEREAMARKMHDMRAVSIDQEGPATKEDSQQGYVFALDHGSRPGPPLVSLTPVPDTSGTPFGQIETADLKMNEHLPTTLVIDHHHVDTLTPDHFPAGASFVNACHSPPVATTALLTWLICEALHPCVAEDTGWLCALGTHGDLGNTLKWEPPFPDMSAVFSQKDTSKSAITSAVPLINAPRRTAAYDVVSAWKCLLNAKSPSDIIRNERLQEARDEVRIESERWAHVPPSFSADGRIAVLRIHSAAQVHPLVATRWASHLKSKKLQFVLVANTGYLPDRVNFSCRIAKCAKQRSEEVDIITGLRELALSHPSGDLTERLGASFARGHVQASGGIVGADVFEELMSVLDLGRRGNEKNGDAKNTSSSPRGKPSQKNTLASYFKVVEKS